MYDKITFAQLIEKVASETGAPKQKVHDLISKTANIAKQGLNKDGYVNIRDLGKISLKWQNARAGRNPQTNEEIEIPAHNSVHFKVSSGFRKFINRNYEHLKPELIEQHKVDEQQEKPPEIKKGESPKPTIIKDESSKSEKNNKGKSRWWLWLVFIAAAVAIVFLFWPDKKTEDISKSYPLNQENDLTIDEKQNKPQQSIPAHDTPVEEKITKEEDAPTEIGTKEKPVCLYQGGNHSVQEGERLRLIAEKYYQRAILWPIIFSANRNLINDPDILSSGMKLEIPAIEGKPGNFSHNDKQLISEAFIHAYLRYKNLKPEKALYYLWVAVKWDVPGSLEKHKNQIAPNDLKRVKKIDGFPDL